MEAGGAQHPDYVGMAVWYCEEVVAQRVPACWQEVAAAQRFLDMRREALSPRGPFYWSDDDVIDFCAFFERLPHTKAFRGDMVAEPVQCFWAAGIFGFRERAAGLRWVRAASLWEPRKNTKTAFAVAVLLYCLNYEAEPGAEGVISAGSEGQAGIPYKVVRKMLDLEPDLREALGAKDTQDYCEFAATGARIELATAWAKNLDGKNPHVVLAEELHAQAQEVIGVLRTAMGARSNPLWLSISTAGRDVNTPAHEDYRACEQVLRGTMRAPRLFTVIYAADKADEENCFSLRVLEKLNPLWGVALNQTSVEEEQAEARRGEAKLQEYKRTRLNIWARAAGNLISLESWERCADPGLDLDALRGHPMTVGVDLASRRDLNAACFMVEVGSTVYAASMYWLCSKSSRMRDDRYADAFRAWAAKGAITLTPGVFIDYRAILRALVGGEDPTSHEVVPGILAGHQVVGVGLDDYQANLMAAEVEARGYQTFIVPKRAKYLTAATEDIIARVEDPTLFQHDGNPVSAWCAGNVCGYWDAADNVLPKKERSTSGANIDGFDALMVANAIRLDYQAGVLGTGGRPGAPAIYLERGLAGVA